MTEWTYQAWFDAGCPGFGSATHSHKDYAVRNVVKLADGSTLSKSGVAASNRHRSAAVTKPWPGYAEVSQAISGQGFPAQLGEDAVSNAELLQAAIDAAIDDVAESTCLPVFVLDADGESLLLDAEGQPTLATVPPKVWYATCLHAVRLYRRNLSPDGVLGQSAFGGTVRVGKFDPDVERLLRNTKNAGVA